MSVDHGQHDSQHHIGEQDLRTRDLPYGHGNVHVDTHLLHPVADKVDVQIPGMEKTHQRNDLIQPRGQVCLFGVCDDDVHCSSHMDGGI